MDIDIRHFITLDEDCMSQKAKGKVEMQPLKAGNTGEQKGRKRETSPHLKHF
jgi:hypothetical protein